jgi:glycosyltransferase involved in cell wall biosynthesis
LRILIAIGVRREREAGAAGVVLSHARELEKRGHTVECWFLDDIFKRPAKPRRLESLLFALAVAKRIGKEREKYDVVNLHAPWGCVYGIWRRLFRPAGSPPYVMTMQGSEERYVQTMRREDRKGRAWNFAWKNRMWHRAYHQTMYDYSIKTADYGAIANREATTCCQLKYGRDPGCMRFVPNGTEERFFSQRAFNDAPATKLLFVGTWLDRKGVYYLADAFGMLAKRISGIRLTVAGCVVAEEQVKSFFAADVRSQVCVMPFVTRDDMPDLYAKHDIFVFPSLVEGMPLTLLEAMATGMPGVTTNTCGMSDVVEDEITGLLVPPADAEALADAVERLCNSAMLREQLGIAGQQSMRHYTWKKVTEKLERVLELAIANRRN